MLVLFQIVLRLTGSDIAAALALLFWSVNMCVPETIAWSTGSMQVLLAFCVTHAFYYFIRYAEERRRVFLFVSWAVFLAGFLVLESNLAFPVIAAGWAAVYCRRALKAAVPMLAVSAAFAGAHQLLVPKHAAGPYAMYFDPVSIQSVTWHYTRWFFHPENVDAFARTPHSFNSAWSVAALSALIAFTVCAAFRRDFRPAFFAVIFLALIAPLTPLRSAPCTWILNSCGRLRAESIARFNMLRVFFGNSSRPHTAPQQYSVTSSCSGMLNSSAAAMDFSTYSLPRTDLRISRPLSNSSLFMCYLLA